MSTCNLIRSGGNPISAPIFSMTRRREEDEGIMAEKQSTASRNISSHVSLGIFTPMTAEHRNAVRFVHFNRSRVDNCRKDLSVGLLNKSRSELYT